MSPGMRTSLGNADTVCSCKGVIAADRLVVFKGGVLEREHGRSITSRTVTVSHEQKIRTSEGQSERIYSGWRKGRNQEWNNG